MDCEGYKNENPLKNEEEYRVVDNSDEITNAYILIDVKKGFDFIGIMDSLR